jgi:hypothetical protein
VPSAFSDLTPTIAGLLLRKRRTTVRSEKPL